MPNYKVTLGYDGNKYQGWQKNKNASSTLQGKLEETLSRLLDEDIKITASGRTDKGAHALGQVINFKTEQALKCATFKEQLQEVLPEDIIIVLVEEVDERFHARFSAKSKTYRYTLWKKDSLRPPLFERHYVYQLEQKVNIDGLIRGADFFLGEHDFKGFSSDKTKKSTVRTIQDIQIVESDNTIEIFITGNGFLYNMVRIIVGTLVELALSQRSFKTIEPIFEEKDREKAGFTAPAEGLCLMEVSY